MKRLIAVLLSLMVVAGTAWAMRIAYGGYLANESALAYNKTYTLNLQNSQIDYLSFQAIYSSATIPTTTFTDSSVNLNSSVISATNTFTSLDPNVTGMVGLQVLFSTGTTNVSPLVPQTTYYVIPVDRNSFKLASTSTGAVAGLGIVLTSSGTAHTYTLRPLPYSGTASFKWEASNDGTNWNPVSLSSVTVTSPTTAPVATLWDFGEIDYSQIRLNVIAPTQGGLVLQAKGLGKEAAGGR